MIKLPWKRGARSLEPKIRAQDYGQPKAHGAGDGQADPRGDLPCQVFGRGGDDPDEARREDLEGRELTGSHEYSIQLKSNTLERFKFV